MKKFIIALTMLFAGPALAADIYSGLKDGPTFTSAPASSWNGVYIGANAGYAETSTNAFGATDGAFAVSSNGVSSNGGFGGLGLGWNHAFGNVVFGLEADADLAGVSGSADGVLSQSIAATPAVYAKPAVYKYGKLVSPAVAAIPAVPAHLVNTGFTASQNLDWFGSARARLGMVFGSNILLYGTGGLGFGGFDDSSSGAIASSGSKTSVGWVAGGGIEYAYSPTWSWKVEYLHFDLGSVDVTGPLNGKNVTLASFDNSFDTIKVGISMHVGAALSPLN